MNRICTLFFLCFACLFFTGCEKDSSEKPDRVEPVTVETTSNDQPANIRTTVASPNLPHDPKRIVSLAPNVTEILFAVGAGVRVVGVTRFCDHPPEATKLPKIGGYTDPDFEAIVGLEPDVVIGVIAGGDSTLPKKLGQAKIPFLFISMDTLGETYDGIELIGNASGQLKEALILSAKIQERMAAIASRARDLDSQPEVLFVLGHDPLVVAGPGSFPDELVTLAGARNAIGEVKTPYPVLDMEKVLQLDPDVIIDAYMTDEGTPEPFWQNFSSLRAVQNDRIHQFEDSALLRPGPRLPRGFERIVTALGGSN